uniref:Transposase DDE domain-containing protein n=1 Tax=Cereibacter sphaeroides (strain ATCC 17025 / ATH 2.4.3) TaxID=349102 RepID=A4WYH0_CERS5
MFSHDRCQPTSARNSGLVGYNGQLAVDAETHLIVTHDITNHGFDRDQLSPMATAAREALARNDLHAVADKGYFSGTEILACHEAGITTTVPRPMTSGNEAKGMFVKRDFLYDPERDIYTCPAGNELTYRGTREEGGLQVRRYWVNDCQTCPIQRRCTSGTERRITRWEHEPLIDAMRERLARDPDPMTLRRCTVEHVFGTLKAWMGTTHFLTRRLKNVRTEMALNVLAYNMKRMISLIGARRLMEASPG